MFRHAPFDAVEDSPRLKNPLRRRLALLLLGLLAAAYGGAALLQRAEAYDEGLIVSGAERILHGQHPYTDFNTGYPPGQFYTVALVFRVFGTSLLAERIWDSLWRLAIVAAACWLAHELAGKNLKLLPLACCAVLIGATGYRLYPMISATLPCLCAVASALRFTRTQNLRWIFVAGLWLGCTAPYRHDLAACAGIAILGSVWRNRNALVWMMAGILVVAGPAAAWLTIMIPQHILRQSFLEFPKVNAAARHLPLLSSQSALLLLLPMAIIAFAALDARRAPADRRGPLVILATAAGLTLILATQRLDTVHAFPSLVLCLVILGDSASPRFGRRVLIASAFLFYGVRPLLEWNAKLSVIRNEPASAIARAGPVRIFSDQAQAVQYIQDSLPSGEKLYVGTTTHSRISVNDALFPFLAERPRATRYDMWLPAMTNSAAVETEIVRELERKAIRFVVLFDAPTFEEPNLSSIDSGVRIVDDYLSSRYHEVAVFGRYHILQRIPL